MSCSTSYKAQMKVATIIQYFHVMQDYFWLGTAWYQPFTETKPSFVAMHFPGTP